MTISKIAQFALALTLTTSVAQADSLKDRLQKFKKNPKAAMNEIPEKKTRGSGRTAQLFTAAQIKNKSFIAAKKKYRKGNFQAASERNDHAENLVDDGQNMITSLAEMETKSLLKGETSVQPWSDYYWALDNGQIAFRYADPRTPFGGWKIKSDYLMSDEAKASSVEQLSPAEKYDLLVGDEAKTLTNAALRQGKMYFDAKGSVESWMGICHGWAPASFMLERPSSAVKVMAADGVTQITFYPSDIKALSSLLWATSAGETKFVGGRCNTKNPTQDENGRLVDQECFDTNPGTWHQAIVNQIGVHKRSFVMDATFDYEVWNQPVRSYQYTYFNPATMNPASTLAEATAELKDFQAPADKFAKYRSPEAKRVVGVSMAVAYIRENMPAPQERDSDSNDSLTVVNYEYDLELDENNKIIGGEWYRNAHPDFLWTPTPDSKARTSTDMALEGNADKDWDGKTAMPKEWSEAAPRASAYGSPMSTIVEKLVKISRSNLSL